MFSAITLFGSLSMGFWLGKIYPSLKGFLATLLAKAIIPLLIFWNASQGQSHSLPITGLAMIYCLCLYWGCLWLTSKPLEALLLSYTNVGWLGLPVVSLLFDDAAVRFVMAFYVGSAIVGNVLCVISFQPKVERAMIVKAVLGSPIVLSLLMGCCCYAVGWSPQQLPGSEFVYSILKWLMSLLGMGLLAMWLHDAPAVRAAMKQSVKLTLVRVLCGCALMLLLGGLMQVGMGYLILSQQGWVLMMLPLLPPAANILVLETHYLKSGTSVAAISGGTYLSALMLCLYAIVIMGFEV